MSKSTYPLKLPNSVKNAAAELAKLDGVSLNQFIAAAVAEKVGTIRTASEFLKDRAGTAKPKDLIKYLRRAPKVAPVEGDKRRWPRPPSARPSSSSRAFGAPSPLPTSTR